MKSLTFILVLALSLIVDITSLLPSVARADNWQTHLQQEQFDHGTFRYEIHFRSSDQIYAERVNEILINYSENIFDYFEYVPKSVVHFNIREATTANGSATVFPTTIVNLFNFPPSSRSHLQALDDWLKGLVLHELIHIVHMEQTRGIPSLLENIFGSVGRLGGVVPRWFAEGIAVWGETHFSEGGRLASREVLNEIYARLLDPNFCASIDCLDEPETYPYGQLAYWMGALFLAELENQKEGTLRCLVIENSKNLPFFLNSAFRRCGLDRAQNLFRDFRQSLIADLEKKQREFLNSHAQEILTRIELPAQDTQGRREGEGVSSWQAGKVVQQDGFIFPIVKERDTYLRRIHFSGREQSELALDGPLHHLAKPAPYSFNRDEFLFSLLGFDLRGEQRSWYRGVSEQEGELKIAEELKFLDGALDAFQIKEDTFLALFHRENRWFLHRFIASAGEKDWDEEILYRWPKLSQLSEISLQQNGEEGLKLLYKMSSPWPNQDDFRYQFHRLPLSFNGGVSGTVGLLYTSRENFQFYGHCLESYLFEQGGESLQLVRSLGGDGLAQNMESIEHRLSWLEDVSDFYWAEHIALARTTRDPQAIYRFEYSCDEVVDEMTVETQRRRVFPKSARLIQSQGEVIDSEQLKEHPRFGHFRPYYWFFNFTRDSSTDLFQVQTTLSDPLLRNNFDLSFDLYTTEDTETKFGGRFAYRYQWYENEISVGFQRRFFQSSFLTNRLDSEERVFSSFRRTVDLGRNLIVTPEIVLSRSKEDDFFSDRVTQRASFGVGLRRFSLRERSFWQSTSVRYRLIKVDVNDRESYWSHRFNLGQQVRMGRNFKGSLRGAYGKLSNESFASGVLYGGGHETAGDQIDFPFYGVRYSDLFGRELATMRLQLEYNLFRVYSAGGGFLPFYLKDIGLLLGADGAYAEQSYLAGTQRFYSNKVQTSQHLGLRFNMTLFYRSAAVIDLLYVRVDDPDASAAASDEWILSFQAPLF